MSGCTCDKCKAMCKRPCWPTPAEAAALIDAGYTDRLMIDWWVGDGLDGGDILLLSPASAGHEGRLAGYIPGQCCFQTADGLCELHDDGLKPLEGVKAIHGQNPGGVHHDIAMLWNNEESQEFVRKWEAER